MSEHASAYKLKTDSLETDSLENSALNDSKFSHAFAHLHCVRSVLIAFLLAFLSFNLANAQEVTTKVEVSESSIQIAEPFDVTISVAAPTGTQVNFPPVTETFGDFDVIEHKDLFDVPASTSNADRHPMRTWTRSLKLETLTTGDLVIPSLEIRTTSTDSKFQQTRSEQKQIRVISVLEEQADPLKIRDLKNELDIEIEPAISYAWIGWAVGGLGGLALLSLLIGKVVTRKKWLTAKQWAMDELDSIRNSQPMKTNDTQTIFSKTESVIKTFLEARFGIPATKQSNSELVTAMESLSTPEITSRISTLLNKSEIAKYAGREFGETELRHTIDETAELIESIDVAETERANLEQTTAQKEAAN